MVNSELKVSLHATSRIELWLQPWLLKCQILELMRSTDGIAEIQKTVRLGSPVTLAEYVPFTNPQPPWAPIAGTFGKSQRAAHAVWRRCEALTANLPASGSPDSREYCRCFFPRLCR